MACMGCVSTGGSTAKENGQAIVAVIRRGVSWVQGKTKRALLFFYHDHPAMKMISCCLTDGSHRTRLQARLRVSGTGSCVLPTQLFEAPCLSAVQTGKADNRTGKEKKIRLQNGGAETGFSLVWKQRKHWRPVWQKEPPPEAKHRGEMVSYSWHQQRNHIRSKTKNND
jgi:hypothetical protein